MVSSKLLSAASSCASSARISRTIRGPSPQRHKGHKGKTSLDLLERSSLCSLCLCGERTSENHPDLADDSSGVIFQDAVRRRGEASEVVLLEPAELADHGVEDGQERAH